MEQADQSRGIIRVVYRYSTGALKFAVEGTYGVQIAPDAATLDKWAQEYNYEVRDETQGNIGEEC